MNDLSITINDNIGAGFNPQYITGNEAIAQKFAIMLFTEAGSDAVYDDRGNTFILQLKAGLLKDKQEAQTVFNVAAASIIARLNADIFGETPSAERLATAVLNDFELDNNKLLLYIVLTFVDESEVEATISITATDSEEA